MRRLAPIAVTLLVGIGLGYAFAYVQLRPDGEPAGQVEHPDEVSERPVDAGRTGPAALADAIVNPPPPDLDRVTPSDTVDSARTGHAHIRIDVLGPDGVSVRKASIELRRGPSTSMHLWTPGESIVELEAGTYEVRVRDQEVSTASQTVSLRPGETKSVELRVAGTGGIDGTLRFAPGDPSTRACVRYLRLNPATEPTPDLLRDSPTADVIDGRFQILNLRSGRYYVGVSRGCRDKPLRTALADVRGGLVDLDLELPALDDRMLVVRAYRPDGAPLSDIELSTAYEKSGARMSGSVQGLAQPDGSVRVLAAEDFWDACEDPKGRCSVEIRSMEFGTRTAELRATGPREVIVRFGAAATLVVSADDYTGSGLEGQLTVELALDAPAAAPDRQVDGDTVVQRRTVLPGQSRRLDADGRQVLGPVEVGTYTLKLGVSGTGFAGCILSTRVDLRPGENRSVMALPRLHTLRVAIDGARSGVDVSMLGAGSCGFLVFTARTDAAGKARFAHLPAGRYQVREGLGSGLGSAMAVSVPVPAGEVRFVPAPVNALEVASLDPASPLAAAGLRNGDQLVGMDGAVFGDLARLLIALQEAKGKDAAVVTVLRDGARLDLLLPTSIFDTQAVQLLPVNR